MKKVLSLSTAILLLSCLLLSCAIVFSSCRNPEATVSLGQTAENPIEIGNPQVGSYDKTVWVNFIRSVNDVKHYKIYADAASDLKTVLGGLAVSSDNNGFYDKLDGYIADWSGKKEYWAFYINGEYSMQGIGDYYTKDGDVIDFVITIDKSAN